MEHPQHGHLRGHSLPGAGGGPQQHVGVGVVERVEDLRLDGVEVAEAVEALKLVVAQGAHGERLQVQQLWGQKNR